MEVSKGMSFDKITVELLGAQELLFADGFIGKSIVSSDSYSIQSKIPKQVPQDAATKSLAATAESSSEGMKFLFYIAIALNLIANG